MSDSFKHSKGSSLYTKKTFKKSSTDKDSKIGSPSRFSNLASVSESGSESIPSTPNSISRHESEGSSNKKQGSIGVSMFGMIKKSQFDNSSLRRNSCDANEETKSINASRKDSGESSFEVAISQKTTSSEDNMPG